MSFIESVIYMVWRGVAIGLIISAPMGPVGMLCIQRTLDKGRRAGLYTGIGAAISDLFYSLLTGFGLSFIEEFLERNQNIIQLVGSAVLIAFGIYLFRKNPTKSLRKPVAEEISIKKNILGGFLFTFSNPLILFLIVGLFARFNFLKPEFGSAAPFAKVLFIAIGYVSLFFGALLWWWFITFSVSKVRRHFNIRSMWLINKIIGSIILIFAVVGIVTASSALASAQETLEYRVKVKCRKPSEPWDITLSGAGGATARLTFRAGESDGDGISSRPMLTITAEADGAQPVTADFTDDTPAHKKMKEGYSGPDPSGSLNYYKITVEDDLLTLYGGIHHPERLLQLELPTGFCADSLDVSVSRRDGLTVLEERLERNAGRPERTIWADGDLLDEYLAASHDPMEGYWQTLDRSLDESLLRLGGDYRYAMVRNGDGYDLIYLSGAKVNADRWEAGMLKARLRPSGILGVWDVEWHDAMHRVMSHELKAQTDREGALVVQFPYQQSQIRLLQSM